MRLQTSSSIALFAVLELAANPAHQLSALEIAEKYGISAHHLAKVLRGLGRAGIVDAVRGVGGGYQLIANPKRLTLFDVIQVFEPIGSRAAPESSRTVLTDASAALDLVLAELDQHAIATFRSITVSTMLKLMARRASSRQQSSRPARQAAARR
ncbi:MAG: Rrf2 family transcriptional regulator [Acidobacteriota bacterium]|nr:Rrf2 family transcriptional regulator [Acidobacteriota bacterium]MDE3169723.1 Rrf2 family transcriptional regulator [Acidobacteriota bacterium]